MKKYDTTFIINGDLGQKEREAIILQARDSLVKKGAQVNRIVRWGMRTLAYEIKKKSRGYYVIFYYCSEPGIIKDFERELRLNENVLRYMTIRFDDAHPSYIPDEGEPGATPVTVGIEHREVAEPEAVPETEIEENLGELGVEDFSDETLEESEMSDIGMEEEEHPASEEEEEHPASEEEEEHPESEEEEGN